MWGWNNMYYRNFQSMDRLSSLLVQNNEDSEGFKMTKEEFDSTVEGMKSLKDKIITSMDDLMVEHVAKNFNEDISRSAKLGWNLYRL